MKKTIAQLRRAEVEKLARLQTTPPTTPTDCDPAENPAIKTAENIMRRFYRLSALSYRVFMAENDSHDHATQYTATLEAQEQRQIKRLSADLQKLYGFTLDYSGIFPSIVYYDEDYKQHHKVRSAPISYHYYPSYDE